jgi:precorrin-8X/cobalt-precorrin-8 methylmutase
VESKQALAAFGALSGSASGSLEYLVVHGRRGGSAITAAAVNAIASDAE